MKLLLHLLNLIGCCLLDLYECSVCDKQFIRRKWFQRHFLALHNEKIFFAGNDILKQGQLNHFFGT